MEEKRKRKKGVRLLKRTFMITYMIPLDAAFTISFFSQREGRGAERITTRFPANTSHHFGFVRLIPQSMSHRQCHKNTLRGSVGRRRGGGGNPADDTPPAERVEPVILRSDSYEAI